MQAVIQTPGMFFNAVMNKFISISFNNFYQNKYILNQNVLIFCSGGKKRTIPFRRQRMQIDSTLPESESATYVSAQPDDPYIADLMQVGNLVIVHLSIFAQMVVTQSAIKLTLLLTNVLNKLSQVFKM